MLNKKYFFLLWFLLCLTKTTSAATPIDGVAAVVNDDVITTQEVRDGTRKISQQLTQARVKAPPADEIQKQVMRHLIDVKLQVQLAKRNGISIEDAEINNAIQDIAARNKLTVTKLREQLTSHGMNYEEYRKNIREQMLLNRIQQQALGNDIKISEKDVEEAVKNYKPVQTIQNPKYHVRNILIPLSESPSPSEVNEAKSRAERVLASIKKSGDLSKIPPAEAAHMQGGDLGWRNLAEMPSQFAQIVAKMNTGDIAGPIRAGNGFHLIQLVEAQGKQTMPTTMTESHVRHILIKVDGLNSDLDAKTRIQEMLHELQGGEDFAVLAKKNSQDPISALKGGDLGWVADDSLVPTFAAAMNDLKINEISKPVKTNYGWHIIQVLERRKVNNAKNSVRQMVREQLYRKKFEERVEKWLQELRAQAYVKENSAVV